MLTNKKRILSIVLALVLAFSAFSGMAFAAGTSLLGSAIPPTKTRDCSTYDINPTPAPATSANVSFVIEAGNIVFGGGSAFRVEIPSVPLISTAAQLFTVTDLLFELNKPAYVSYGLQFNENGQPVTQKSTYVDEVIYNKSSWEAGQLGFDGWVFRVNDKFPVYQSGTDWIGASIFETNIKDGDIIHFFYDFPSDFSSTSGSFAANYVRALNFASTSTSLTVQLQGHTTYINPSSYDMYVDNYVNLQGGITVTVVDSSGATLTGTSDINGRVTFTGTFTSGSYIVETNSVLYTGGSPTFANNVYFVLTGAYSKI
jgi:hypothetical protein